MFLYNPIYNKNKNLMDDTLNLVKSQGLNILKTVHNFIPKYKGKSN